MNTQQMNIGTFRAPRAIGAAAEGVTPFTPPRRDAGGAARAAERATAAVTPASFAEQLATPRPVDDRTLGAAVPAKERAAITKTASQYESMFIGQMFNEMWSTVEVDPEFGGGHGEEMFRSMMVDEYGKKAISRGGFGLAAQVEKAMLRARAAGQDAAVGREPPPPPPAPLLPSIDALDLKL